MYIAYNINLALQGFHNEQAKEGIFTCFYHPEHRGRKISVSLLVSTFQVSEQE